MGLEGKEDHRYGFVLYADTWFLSSGERGAVVLEVSQLTRREGADESLWCWWASLWMLTAVTEQLMQMAKIHHQSRREWGGQSLAEWGELRRGATTIPSRHHT